MTCWEEALPTPRTSPRNHSHSRMKALITPHLLNSPPFQWTPLSPPAVSSPSPIAPADTDPRIATEEEQEQGQAAALARPEAAGTSV